MRRILRYISFTLMYLVISIASAYGVILLSFNNNSTEDSSSNAQMPIQISNILYNVMQNQSMEFDLNVSIKNEKSSNLIKANCYLDLSNGLENMTFASDLSLIEDSDLNNTTQLSVVYQNKNVFIDAFNNKFYFSTDNFIGSIYQLLSLLELDLPSFDINSLDLNEILNTFSNLKETTLENIKIIEIDLPVVEKIIITTDLNYNLMAFEIPTINLEDTQINIEGVFNLYPQTININKNTEDYKDLTLLMEIANKFLYYAKNNIIAIDGNLSIDNELLNNVEYKLFVDLPSSTISLQLLDNINLTLQNNSIYFNLFNIYLKFDLSELPALISLLKDEFNINLPEILTNLNNNNISFQNISDIFEFLNFNLSDLDLSFIEQLNKIDNNYNLVLTNIASITFETSDVSINKMIINSDYFKTEMDFVEKAQMPQLNEDFYKNTELSTLIPYISSFKNLFNSNSVSGDFSLTMPNSNTTLAGQYQIILDTYSPEIYLTLNDGQINVAIYESKIFVKLGKDISLLFDLNNSKSLEALAAFKDLLKSLFDIEISKDNILFLLLSQLHSDVNETLISKIYSQQSSLNVELANKILVTINDFENEMQISATGKDENSSSLKVTLTASDSYTPLFELDKENEDTKISSTYFLVTLGVAGIGIAISTNQKEVMESSMNLFGFDAKLYFVFNKDKTIKQASITLSSNGLIIKIEKNENDSKITLGDFVLSSSDNEQLKEKGEEIYNKLPIKI